MWDPAGNRAGLCLKRNLKPEIPVFPRPAPRLRARGLYPPTSHCSVLVL